MDKFKVGCRVLRIAPDFSGHLKVGQIYTVKDITICCEKNIDIGLKTPNRLPAYCERCGKVFEGSSAWYCCTKSFIVLDDEVKQEPKKEFLLVSQ